MPRTRCVRKLREYTSSNQRTYRAIGGAKVGEDERGSGAGEAEERSGGWARHG
jgi:hypothetical protein